MALQFLDPIVGLPKPPLLSLLLLLAACAERGPPACTAAETADHCAVASELFLGLSRPDGGTVGEAELADFLAETVTPRFPDGFTVLWGDGQWRDASGRIAHEASRILVIVHGADAEQRLAEVIAAYKTRFHQESVLRLDVKAAAWF